MNLKKHIPNVITLGNLFCGCLALVKTFEGDLVWAAYLVGIALVLDFFDGFTARMLKVSSAIGGDLDSLADMVTFGVVPGVVMFKMLRNGLNLLVDEEPAKAGWTIYPPSFLWISYFAFIITIFSCIRLAKFNNDTRQSESFIGLNTPSNAMIICSLPLIMQFQSQYLFITKAVANPIILIILSLVLSLLLVSEIPFFALKFKNFSWADNKIRFTFLGLAVTLLLVFRFMGIPMAIILYILLSIVNNIFSKNKV